MSPGSDVVGIQLIPCQGNGYGKSSFHFALLLDTSGSMEGSRLETVKRTLHLLLDDLTAEDALTIISYNSDAEILCEKTRDHAHIREKVDALKAGGMTNMESAILKLSKVSDVDAVFLLTDGHVNQGSIQTAVGLAALLRQTVPRHVPVHTLGYGSDHNVDILKTIAMDTRGTYTFADKDEIIPKTVGSIVGGLRDAVAMDVVLQWSGDVRFRCMESGAGAAVAVVGASNEYFVGSLLAEKPVWIVGMTTGVSMAGASSPLSFVARSPSAAFALEIPCVEPTELQRDVEEQWIRIQTTQLFDKIHAGMVGKAMIMKLLSIESQIDAIPDRTPLLMCLYAQLQEMKQHLDNIHANPTLGRTNNLYRMASNMTTVARQQGTLTPTQVVAAMGAAAMGAATMDPDVFTSPTQRTVRDSMLSRYSQNPV